MSNIEQKEIKVLQDFNHELQIHFTLQYERIKSLEQAIINHQEEMKNHWKNTGINERQVPDCDTNKKLWNCL